MSIDKPKRKKWLKSKSFFYKYFTSYSIILIVPFLTIVLLFISSQKLVKEQIHLANNNTLKQFFERVDDIVKGAYADCVEISNQQMFIEYPDYVQQRSGKTTFETWEISKALASYIGERYHDVFIYYPIDNRIVSGRNASVNIDKYYDIYYDEKGNYFGEEFRNLAKSTSGKPIICSMNGKGTDSYLCVAMKYGRESQGFTVVIVFDRSYISGIMRSVEANNQKGIAMIHNALKETVFSADERLVSYALEGRLSGNGAFEKNIEGEKYVLQVQNSAVLDAYYTYAVPYSYYWEKLFYLYFICGIGAIISVGVGIFLAKEEAVRVYRPVELLIKNLQKLGKSDYDDMVNTEFEFIRLLFDEKMNEKVEVNIALRQGEVLKRDNFIYSLFNGNCENTLEDANDIFSANGIHLCSDCFCVIVLEIEQEEGIVENEMRSFVLSNVFCELLNEKNQGFFVALPADRYAILVNVQKETEKEYLIALLEEGKGFLKQHYKIGMTMGVSQYQEGMTGINVAYEEACLALKYKYLLGEECVIDFVEVGRRSFEYVSLSEGKLLFKVSDYLFGDSRKMSASKLVDSIMLEYGINKEASMETIECFKFEAISTLNRAMTQGGFWSEQGKNMVQELLESATLQKFRDKFAEILSVLCRMQQEKEEGKDACAKAFDYIETHYSDAQLSLGFLGELLDVSPSYLSKLFKEKYQISIPDFITLTRINGAKLQLRSTKNNIGKVAQDNGFLSSSVFVKTFKKFEGITPGRYREFFEGKERNGQ